MEHIQLKNARLRLGLSQKQVAELVGISRCFYTQIEKGTRKPSLDVALKISEMLGVAVNDIFFSSKVAICNERFTGTDSSTY